MMGYKGIVDRVFKRLKGPARTETYESYEGAAAHCDGYEDPDIIQVVLAKTETHREALLRSDQKVIGTRQMVQNMFVFDLVSKDRPLEVLEIGGACGASYFELDHFLPGRIRKWHIVETPSMAKAGGARFGDDRLAIYDDMDRAVSSIENRDLLVAQGVLQYLKDPLGSLDRLLGLGFNHVYISRTVAGENIEDKIVTKQVTNLSAHGPGNLPRGWSDKKKSQVITIIPFEDLLSHSKVGHEMLYTFDEDENVSLNIRPKRIDAKTVGFLLQRKSL